VKKKLSNIIKQLNQENTPPGGWKKDDTVYNVKPDSIKSIKVYEYNQEGKLVLKEVKK